MPRTLLIYLVVLFLFGTGMYVALERGRHLAPPAGTFAPAIEPGAPLHPTASTWDGVRENLKGPLGRLLLQVIVIIIATRAVGAVFKGWHQPSVIGEILAGILLGPSLLGWLWPGATALIFPPESLGILRVFSQIGVCLFMFVVGLELEVSQLKQKAPMLVVVSHASILFPYLLGVGLALFLFSNYAAPGASFLPFALFLGIAMSITAFPVLARILAERGIVKTFLGSAAITCAAVNDATAWGILACVVATARAGSLVATLSGLGLVVVFVAMMFWLLRPRLPGWLGVDRMKDGAPSGAVLSAVLVLLLTSAFTTECIGIHALFGAFLAGVVMPQRHEFREYLVVRLENFSSLFLLPLFFAFSGLRTHVGLIDDWQAWFVCGAIIAVATIGKLGGTMITARLVGLGWNDSFALGALMNTRGLVELVALNLGYDLGILPPRMFAMLVLMALVTTALTGPLLNLAERARRSAVGPVSPPVRS